MTVMVLVKFILYVSNQGDLIHRDSGFYGHNSKFMWGENGYKDKWK